MSLLSCKSAPVAQVQDSFPVAVPTPAADHYEREYVGEVQAVQRAEIRARVKGRIESVAVDEGQAVKRGQVLFTIGSSELKQQLRRTRAAAASAAADLRATEVERTNTGMLLEKQVVSPAEMSLLESKIQSLAAKLDEARAHEAHAALNLAYAEVRAPFDGVVNRIPKKAGSLVDEGELLTTLTDPSELFVYFRLSEQEYLEQATADQQGRPGEVSFKLANGQLLVSIGKMDAVESEIDRNTGTIAFRARFANDRNILKHGSSGKVVVKSMLKDAVVIPQRSTFEVQDHVYVYVVGADGRARARRIHPKLRLKDGFVVQSGIAAGERFIAEGVQRVKDGERVAILTSPSTAPSTASAL
jgi:membrane fusion protein (multidrug efflux system)